jgi:hypothetical protein
METLVGTAQRYELIALYRSVLVPEENVEEVLTDTLKNTASTFDEAARAPRDFKAEPMSGLSLE